MKILIVEDDEVTSNVLKDFIGRCGFSAEVAENGQEALDKIKNTSFDLVLLDIFLPDVLGYDLIPDLKRSNPEIKIITMTGQNTLDMERKVRGYGITYYMGKPVSLKELKSILDHLSK